MARSSYQFRQRVDALRKPLLAASADGFEAVSTIPDLGRDLRAAVDSVVDAGGQEIDRELLAWRRALEGFEALDSDLQGAQVARGLRICRGLAGPIAAKPEPVAERGGGLAHATSVLPGIGPAMAERLAERGIECVEDLLWLVPRRYDDVRAVRPLAEALVEVELGERVTARGLVTSTRFARRGRVRWVDLRLADPQDSTVSLVVRFFNAHASMCKRFPETAEVTLSGAYQERGNGAEMANPDVLAVTLPDGTRKQAGPPIIARYADIPGVPAGTLRKACAAAVERYADELADAVPPELTERLGLVSLPSAIRALHAPPDDTAAERVEALNAGQSEEHRRLAFDELFVLGIVVGRRRLLRRADRAAPCPAIDAMRADLPKVLPFTPTGAQDRAIDAISADLAREVPMNRLLQGDVGSGKTAVAFAAALQAVRSGRQAALMAPTEILVEQHHATLAQLCAAAGMSCAKLTASVPKGVRVSTLSRLAAGQIDMVVGTHSLLSDGVVFENLGLAIVDEQHRFGVAQRVRLRDKGGADGMPHLLVMTATPIPRTLALTAYGDLDVTVIDELPPGRTPIRTTVMGGSKARDKIYRRVGARVAEGARAFVVCPLVEPGDPEETRASWADATSVATSLDDTLEHARVGLVHGRMASVDRDRVMTAFREGELDILVATTVIEVGVDVPEATLMIIEDADRFGLAQLHQLRGRVGRGGGQSHCVLLTKGRKTPEGARRLEVMAETTDGFRIAEEDLLIRGPGEMLGTRQAGLPKLRFGDLRQHAELLAQARQEADSLLSGDPELAAPGCSGLRRALAERCADVEAYGAESG